MKKTDHKPAKARMIHIRLDANTHRGLKILAARSDATVQRIVEALIRRAVGQGQETL